MDFRFGFGDFRVEGRHGAALIGVGGFHSRGRKGGQVAAADGLNLPHARFVEGLPILGIFGRVGREWGYFSQRRRGELAEQDDRKWNQKLEGLVHGMVWVQWTMVARVIARVVRRWVWPMEKVSDRVVGAETPS